MKILFHNILTDISGFHQVVLFKNKLTIYYPITPSGIRPDPDEFSFENETSAESALMSISQLSRTDRTVEFIEYEGRFSACEYHTE